MRKSNFIPLGVGAVVALITFAGADSAQAGWKLATYNYQEVEADAVTAKIPPNSDNISHSDPDSSVSPIGTSIIKWHWEPSTGESATPPYNSGRVSHLVNFNDTLNTSVTPTPGNAGTINATAKFTLGYYDPAIPVQTPTEQWDYSKKSSYNYRTGLVDTILTPNPTPAGEYLTQAFNVTSTNDGVKTDYYLEATFQFKLLNEAHVDTNYSRGPNPNQSIQGGSGIATSGPNSAKGSGQLMVSP